MAKERLTLAMLAKLDGGRHARDWQRGLDRLQADCVERPNVKGARKLALVAIIEPETDDADAKTIETCSIRFEVSATIPREKSRTYSAGVRGTGLIVNELSPDNPGQMTLDEAAARVRSEADREKRRRRKDRTGEAADGAEG